MSDQEIAILIKALRDIAAQHRGSPWNNKSPGTIALLAEQAAKLIQADHPEAR